MTALQQTIPVSQVIQAALNYFVNNGEKPVVYQTPPEQGLPQRSGQFQWHTVPIADARALRQSLSLDRD